MKLDGLKRNFKDFLFRLIGQRSIKVSSGSFSIFDVPMVFLPHTTLALINRLSHDDKRIKTVLHGIGHIQSYTGTKLLIDKFGINKSSEDMIYQFKFQSDMVGIGNSEFSKVDPEKMKFEAYAKSQPAKDYVGDYGNDNIKIDDYYVGLMEGLLSAFYDEEIVCREERCMVSGEEVCLFKCEKADLKNKQNKDIKSFLSKSIKFKSVKNLVKK